VKPTLESVLELWDGQTLGPTAEAELAEVKAELAELKAKAKLCDEMCAWIEGDGKDMDDGPRALLRRFVDRYEALVGSKETA